MGSYWGIFLTKLPSWQILVAILCIILVAKQQTGSVLVAILNFISAAILDFAKAFSLFWGYLVLLFHLVVWCSPLLRIWILTGGKHPQWGFPHSCIHTTNTKHCHWGFSFLTDSANWTNLIRLDILHAPCPLVLNLLDRSPIANWPCVLFYHTNHLLSKEGGRWVLVKLSKSISVKIISNDIVQYCSYYSTHISHTWLAIPISVIKS